MATTERLDLTAGWEAVRNPLQIERDQNDWYLYRNGERVRPLDSHLETDLVRLLAAAQRREKRLTSTLRQACTALAAQDMSQASATVQAWHAADQQRQAQTASRARTALARGRAPASLPLFP